MTVLSEHRATVARLAAAQKSNRGAGGYSRWVNRPLGRHVAAAAYRVNLTPNQVSVISALFTFTAIALIASVRPAWYLSIVIAGLLVAGYAFDSADGQIARLRNGGTTAGEWLDHVFDAVKVSTFHLAIAICWFRFYRLEHPAWLLVPLGFSAVYSVFFLALTLSDMLRRIARLQAGGSGVTTASVKPDESAPVLRSLLVLPNDYGVLALSILLLSRHTAFTVVYTVELAANVVFVSAGCVRWFREMLTL